MIEKKINGPINVIRLEKQNKVIYLFMNFREDLYKQTQCDSVHNNDITEYLVSNFDELSKQDKIYDFFF